MFFLFIFILPFLFSYSHFASVNGVLSDLSSYKGNLSENNDYYISDDIFIVAGGGGGAYCYFYLTNSNSNIYYDGKHGGGYKTSGATQTTGADFGQGYLGSSSSSATFVTGSGGGWYGGIQGTGGTGGTGYIASSRLISGGTITKHMAMYEATETYLSDDTETKTIAALGYNATATADYAKSGSGYAIITYCGDSADDC